VSLSFLFQGTNSENLELEEFLQSIGLRKQALTTNYGVAVKPEDGPGCYLTFLSESELHPYGDHNILSSSLDPLIAWDRGFFKNPYLVITRFHLSTDNKEVSGRIKPYFKKIKKYVGEKYDGNRGLFISNAAKELIELGAVELNFWDNQSGDAKIDLPNTML